MPDYFPKDIARILKIFKANYEEEKGLKGSRRKSFLPRNDDINLAGVVPFLSCVSSIHGFWIAI